MSQKDYSLSILSLNSLNLSEHDLVDKDVSNDDEFEENSQINITNLYKDFANGQQICLKDDIILHNDRDTPNNDGYNDDDDDDSIQNLDPTASVNSQIFLPQKIHSKFNKKNLHLIKYNKNKPSPPNLIDNHDSNNDLHNPTTDHNLLTNCSPPLNHPSTNSFSPHPPTHHTIYSNHHLNEWVSLNVGGKVFTTTKMTLITHEPDSMLARMFDSEWNHWRDEGGAILIDRSPEYFEVIMNYLRTQEVVVDEGVNLKGVLLEAKFYGLVSMVEELSEMMAKKMKMKVEGDDDDLPISRRDFLKLIVGTASSAELRCQGINLEGSDLSRLDLRNINFKFANLRRCNLSFTNLSFCNFERADLSHSILDHSTMLGCRMLCTNLEAASMKACNFQDAGETHTCLQGASMKGVDLEGSRMAAINLRVANLKNSNLQNCDLRGAILAGTDLENCNLSGCDLQEANLRGANLKGATFELMLNPLHMSQAVR